VAKIAKIAKSRIVPPVGGLRGNVDLHGSFLACWNARFDFLLVLIIELLSPALTVEALLADIGRNRGFLRGWVGQFERKFQGPTSVGVRKLESLEWTITCVVCVILRLAVLIQYRRVSDRRTRCYSFDPSVVSIDAVVGRQWVAVDRVLKLLTSCRQLTVLCCLNKCTVLICCKLILKIYTLKP